MRAKSNRFHVNTKYLQSTPELCLSQGTLKWKWLDQLTPDVSVRKQKGQKDEGDRNNGNNV